MALPVRNGIDLVQTAILNAVAHPVTADPAAPAEGQFWYRSDTDRLMIRANGVSQQVAVLADIITAASGLSVSPTGGLVSTNAQAAFAEIQGDIDGVIVPELAAQYAAIAALNAAVAPVAAAVATTAGAADAGKLAKLDASGLLARELTQSPRTYAYLKTSGGTVNTAITADITAGRLATGDTVITSAYWQNGTAGGCNYRVVAAATGTDDGGAYITAGARQLQAVFNGRVDVTQYGADNTGATACHTHVQAAIDWVLNETGTDYATQTRTPSASIYFPAGTFLVGAKIRVRSAISFTMRGEGARTRIQATGTFDRVLDLNGVAYSLFENLTIVGGSTAVVTEVVRLEWFADTAESRPSRSSTQNRFRNIEIREFGSYVDAFCCGKNSSSTQVDHITFEHCIATGSWTAGETTNWQHGYRVGSGSSGNQLNYFFHSCSSIRNRNGLAQYAALPATWIGGGMTDQEVDFLTSGQCKVTVMGTRSEGSERFYSDSGGGSYSNMIAIKNCRMAVNGMNADTRVVRHRTGGSLVVDEMSFGTEASPSILVDVGSGYASASVTGCTSQTAPASFLVVTNLTRTKVVSFGYKQASGSTVTSVAGNYISSDLELDGALDHDGTTAGFFGTAPAVQQAATSIADLSTALKTYGLLTSGSSVASDVQVMAYSGSAYAALAGARVFLRQPTNPYPTGLATGDIVATPSTSTTSPTLGGSNSYTGSSTHTSFDLTRPSGFAVTGAGLIIAGVDDTVNADSFTLTGWTELNQAGNGTSGAKVGAFYLPAPQNSTETVSVVNGAAHVVGWYFRVDNPNQIAPINVTGTETIVGSATSATIAGITTTVDNCLVVAVAALDGSDMLPVAVTSGSGWSAVTSLGYSGSTGIGLVYVTKTMATAGAVGDLGLTATVADGWGGFMFALAPATTWSLQVK